MAEDEEDDYLSMTFGDTSAPVKETSLQRIARLKTEAAERARLPSKAELAAQEQAARDAALATQLDSSNKGAKMMAKMGFQGGALGQTTDARTQPIELLLKNDRGGIGMDSDKKRKVREAAEAAQEGEKRQKVGLNEYRERNRVELEEKRMEGLMWAAMKVLEGLNMDEEPNKEAEGYTGRIKDIDAPRMLKSRSKNNKLLTDVNVLYRPLLKQRLEKERDHKMRHELNNSVSMRNETENDEDEDTMFDKRVEELDDEDPELQAFEELSFAGRLEKLVNELREKYQYCFWCKYRYSDKEMEGCPGLTEDEHG